MIHMYQLRTPGYIVISDFGSAVQAITVRESELSFIQGSYQYRIIRIHNICNEVMIL